MVINEKKGKFIIIGAIIIFVIVSSFSIFYIFDLRNKKENEKVGSRISDIQFLNEKNSDSVLRMINNSGENTKKTVENNNLTEKEILSKKILMAKIEDRTVMRLNYIKEKILNDELIDYYIKYKRANLKIDFTDKEIFQTYFSKKEQNKIILDSYKNDFDSSLKNVINNFDILDTYLKAKLQKTNDEKNINNENILKKYNEENNKIQNEEYDNIEDLKIKLLISRDKYNEEKNTNLKTYTEKEDELKEQINTLLKIYTKVITFDNNEKNKKILNVFNNIIFDLNDESDFIYNMEYIQTNLENIYNNNTDIEFNVFVKIYLEEYEKPKLVMKKDLIIANEWLDLKLDRPFLSKTNKKFSYDDLNEEEIKNIFIKLP